MQSTFSQKFLMAVFLGFAAACLLWFMRHIVSQAMYETGAGWHDMFNKTRP